VIERKTEVGGLHRSFEIGGGVSISEVIHFTPHAEVNEFVATLMAGNWSAAPPDARI
jgi:hypothetical protein